MQRNQRKFQPTVARDLFSAEQHLCVDALPVFQREATRNPELNGSAAMQRGQAGPR
jgi:hypothetical protein